MTMVLAITRRANRCGIRDRSIIAWSVARLPDGEWEPWGDHLPGSSVDMKHTVDHHNAVYHEYEWRLVPLGGDE